MIEQETLVSITLQFLRNNQTFNSKFSIKEAT